MFTLRVNIGTKINGHKYSKNISTQDIKKHIAVSINLPAVETRVEANKINLF